MITQITRDAAERYFKMRINSPDSADRALAEIIQGAVDAQVAIRLESAMNPKQFTPRAGQMEPLHSWQTRAYAIANP